MDAIQLQSIWEAKKDKTVWSVDDPREPELHMLLTVAMSDTATEQSMQLTEAGGVTAYESSDSCHDTVKAILLYKRTRQSEGDDWGAWVTL